MPVDATPSSTRLAAGGGGGGVGSVPASSMRVGTD